MEPVVTLLGRILQIREIDEPMPVGYGATYVAAPPARLDWPVGVRSPGIFGELRARPRRDTMRDIERTFGF